MDAVLWIIAIVVGLIVIVAVLAVSVRGMRPKLPDPPLFSTAPHAAPPPSAATTPGLTPEVVAEVDRLVVAGQKIHAIKVYRDHSGVSLKEAKDRIEHWSVSTTAPHPAAVSHTTAPHSSITATPSSVRASLPPSVASTIDAQVAGGSAIAAIKTLREHTGLGLKESKNVIDAWPHTHAS
ncbi:50S ribosomal protein L7/L12 [Microbacterium oxydans]|uniref:50S ribosomal protein L7/L12 n=1 Tax=Microbacterium oxydans TaxID=82380 RepID=A0A0F0L2L9_9MICO|nr:ribosomal protein L7/L12 [Microbacterium oxydans]KJL26939.1 50S ribosomal protein L7/L12 [Microbacterium oxydans]